MKLQPYLDISQSADSLTFLKRMVEFGQELEFELINAMVVVDKPGQGVVRMDMGGNTPVDYAEIHKSCDVGRRDPVMRRLKKLSVPFSYDQDMYVREGAGDVWERQAAYGYKTGIAVALHLPDHTHFLLGIDRRRPLPYDQEVMTQTMAALQLLAAHAQDFAIRKLITTASDSAVPKLTRRELEVLRWTLDGKSSWSVGQILAVSETTVNFHIKNAARKLHVSSKHQAVLKALSYGLI